MRGVFQSLVLCLLIVQQGFVCCAVLLHSLLYNVYMNYFQIQEVSSADYFKLYTFEFSDFELTDDDTVVASIRMMLELDFMNAVHTKQRVSY